jgi:phage tail sheath protein FI
MPPKLTPGVYVDEVPSTSKPIEGVSTSVAAFVGRAPFGPINVPIEITNWTKFVDTFGNPYNRKAGPFMKGAYLAHAVDGFFRNGGTSCYVVRVGEGSAPGAPQLALKADEGDPPFRVIAREKVPEPVTVKIEPAESPNPAANGNGGPVGYKVTITAGPPKDAEDDEEPIVEVFPKEDAAKDEANPLTISAGKDYLVTKINRESRLIKIEETGPSLLAKRSPLKTEEYTLQTSTDLVKLDVDTIDGDIAERSGVAGLAAVDDVTMVCVPDIMSIEGDEEEKEKQVKDLQSKLVQHAENAQDRMVILDPPPGKNAQQVRDWRSEFLGASKFATLYYPWIEVMDPVDDQPVMVPPCGHIAGVWARTDGTRGVHKAPANEALMGVTGLAYQVTKDEQAKLNPEGINCIRAFPGRGIRVWGARTMSTREDPEWRYINVRRLFNFISESIMDGTQWAVFEPNDATLWTQLRVSASNFLTRVWRDGALFGATPAEAFYVKCDEETNPPDLVEAGQVTIEIGIAPVKPAEFVVFRISQFQVGADSTA